MSSQLPTGFPATCPTSKEKAEKRAEDLESLARLVEGFIDSLKSEEERQFYREVVQTYREAARDILRNA